MKAIFFITLFFSSFINASDAVKNLDSKWSQVTHFEATIIYPQHLIVDENQTIYVTSSANNTLKIASLTSDNRLVPFYEYNMATAGVAYQKSLKRFIFTTNTDGLYTFDFNKNTTKLKDYGVHGNNISVADDDSFYTCSASSNLGLYHYDKDGNLLETLVDKVAICSDILLDKQNNVIYYTSSYDGSVYKYDLNSTLVTTVANNIGIPGTYEPITLALGASNELFIFPSADGLYRYINGEYTLLVHGEGGGGEVIYSPLRDVFISASGAGSNLMQYNLNDMSSTPLTPVLNAFSVAKTAQNKIYACNDKNEITTVESDGYHTFLTLPDELISCGHLQTDKEGRLYAGLGSGKIIKIDENKQSYTLFANYSNQGIRHMAYDSYHDVFLTEHAVDENTVDIWKVPLQNPTLAEKIYTLTDVHVSNVSPSITCDDAGNAYILERRYNKIYKLDIDNKILSEIYSNPLANEAITVPDMVYMKSEDALLISTIEDFQKISLQTLTQTTFATNNGGVDNLSLYYAMDGNIVATHSGRVFEFINPKNSYVLPNIVTGWNLLGGSNIIDTQKSFGTNLHVKIIWSYDNEEKTWLAYSPDTNVSENIGFNSISPLETILPNQGFWLLYE